MPLEETIASFDALANGEYDHLPEQAFFLAGGLEDLAKKAESLGAKMDENASDGAPASDDDNEDDDGKKKAEDDDKSEAKDKAEDDDTGEDKDSAKVEPKNDGKDDGEDKSE